MKIYYLLYRLFSFLKISWKCIMAITRDQGHKNLKLFGLYDNICMVLRNDRMMKGATCCELFCVNKLPSKLNSTHAPIDFRKYLYFLLLLVSPINFKICPMLIGSICHVGFKNRQCRVGSIVEFSSPDPYVVAPQIYVFVAGRAVLKSVLTYKPFHCCCRISG